MFINVNVSKLILQALTIFYLYLACMTTEGKQCIFPFKYKNKTESGDDQELTFNKCSTEDIYRPWCPTSKKRYITLKHIQMKYFFNIVMIISKKL